MLRNAGSVVDPARPYKERVRKSVEISQRLVAPTSSRSLSATKRRSARRQIVRAKWRHAPGIEPPGWMKFESGGRSACASSMARSSACTSAPPTEGRSSRRSAGSVASSLPRLNSASCVHASQASRRAPRSWSCSRGRNAARAMPIALESSSIVPYVSIRGEFFLTRPPPISPVIPWSPVRV